jgi:hypothetical protein
MIPGLGQPRAPFGQVAPVTLTTLIALEDRPRRLDKSLVAATTAGWAAGGMLFEDGGGVAVVPAVAVCAVADGVARVLAVGVAVEADAPRVVGVTTAAVETEQPARKVTASNNDTAALTTPRAL